ncbi:MAG: hypothetical protein NWE98_06140 [Candidatus Bathyarchaeota archaeon]|nr:hypothetical protein [Candidatus Bathyarchaeota archaeon]
MPLIKRQHDRFEGQAWLLFLTFMAGMHVVYAIIHCCNEEHNKDDFYGNYYAIGVLEIAADLFRR